MVVELNGVRNTKSYELSGVTTAHKNCVIKSEQKIALKSDSFQTLLEKPMEEHNTMEGQGAFPTKLTIRAERKDRSEEEFSQVELKSSSALSMEDLAEIGKSETHSINEESIHLNGDARQYPSLRKPMDDADETGYQADNDESDCDLQLSWIETATDFKERQELSLEEPQDISQSQHSVDGFSRISNNNTFESSQEQVVLGSRNQLTRTNSVPISEPFAPEFLASDAKGIELSGPLTQMRSSLEHRNTVTTTPMALNSNELVALHHLGKRQELISWGTEDSGIDLLSSDALDSLSSRISEENSKRIMGANDRAIVVSEEVDGSALIATSLESQSKKTLQRDTDFINVLDDSNILEVSNKAEGGIAHQMNALSQGGDSPLSIAPLRQVALQLAKALDNRVDHLTFQLDPEHLGKVEIELKIMNDNHVQAIFHVDNPESYELLRRDSAELQALLNEAGFESNADDFSFNYRDPNSDSGEKESSFQSSSRGRRPQEIQGSSIEGMLDVESLLRKSDPSKILDTLI